MPKFVQNIKLFAFEKLFELDTRVKLIVPNSAHAPTISWLNDFIDKYQAGAVGTLAEYLGTFVPRLLITAHDQCVLFMHIFFNESAYSPVARDNIFVFLYPNNKGASSIVFDNLPTKGRALGIFLEQAQAKLNIDPLVFLLLSPTYFPLARYYFQFTLKNKLAGVYFSAGEFALISFFDTFKSALAEFFSLHWPQVIALFAEPSADSKALTFSSDLTFAADLSDSVIDDNTFIAYFFYFLDHPGSRNPASLNFRDFVQNLLKARFSLGQLLVNTVGLETLDDYAQVDWAHLDANFFSPDAFVHYLLPSVSLSRSRLVDYLIEPNDSIKNISVFNGQLISTSTVSNLDAQNFAGWTTYFGTSQLNSEQIFFNRICTRKDFFLFESTGVSGLFVFATNKLNMRIKNLGVTSSAISVFVSFTTWPPVTNRRLTIFYSNSIAPDTRIRVVDVESSNTLLDVPLESWTRLNFSAEPKSALQPVLTTRQYQYSTPLPTSEEFWSSFMYTLEFVERSNPISYCTSEQTFWKYNVALLKTSGAIHDPDEPNMFRVPAAYTETRAHFEPIDSILPYSSGLINDDSALAFSTIWPGRTRSSSITRTIRVGTATKPTCALMYSDDDVENNTQSIVPFRFFSPAQQDPLGVSASILNAGCCNSTHVRYFCANIESARLVLFELVFSVADGSLNVSEYLTICCDSNILGRLLKLKQLPTGVRTFSATVLVYDTKTDNEKTSCVFMIANTLFLCQVQFAYNGRNSGNGNGNTTKDLDKLFLTRAIFETSTSISQIDLDSRLTVIQSTQTLSSPGAQWRILFNQSEFLVVQAASTNRINCKVYLDTELLDTWAFPTQLLPLRVSVILVPGRVYCVFLIEGNNDKKRVYKIKVREKTFIQIEDEQKNSQCKKILIRSADVEPISLGNFIV